MNGYWFTRLANDGISEAFRKRISRVCNGGTSLLVGSMMVGGETRMSRRIFVGQNGRIVYWLYNSQIIACNLLYHIFFVPVNPGRPDNAGFSGIFCGGQRVVSKI